MKFIIINIFIFATFLLSARIFRLLDDVSNLVIWSIAGVIIITIQAVVFFVKKGLFQSFSFISAASFFAYIYFSGGYIGYSSFIAEGPSNKPTIEPGDEVVSRLFDLRITKGSMVTANLKDGKYLKRIHGVPGDKIIICGGYVYVNDVAHYLQNYSWEREHIDRRSRCSDSANRLTLGYDEYYLVGDNISNSYDSRDFGAVKESDIIAIHLYLFRGDMWMDISKANFDE